MNNIKFHIVQFIVMILIGMFFNPMNMLAHDINHVYLSLTLFYGGVLMASNMIWSHEIIHFLSMGHFNTGLFLSGILLSIITTICLLRKQLFVNDNQWLKRMISHHSTALTTSEIIKTKQITIKSKNLQMK